MKTKTKLSVNIILLLLVAFHLANNLFWLQNSRLTADVHCSEGVHANKHLDFYRYLKFHIIDKFIKTGHFLELPIKQLIKKYGFVKGFFVPFLNSIAMLWGIDSTTVLRYYNTFYLILLIIVTFFIGKYYLDERNGILSAFLISMYPGIFGISRNIEVELALTGMVALTTYFVLKSNNFLTRKYTIIAALFFGVSINVKLHSLFFLIPLLLFDTICVLRIEFKEPAKYKNFFEKAFYFSSSPRIINILIFFIIVLFFSIPYFWAIGLQYVWNHLWYVTSASYLHQPLLGSQPFKDFSFIWFLYYIFTSIQTISLVLFFLFVFSIPIFLKKANREKRIYLIILIVVPFIILSLLSIKLPRYFFMAYPAMAVITSYALLSMKKLWRRIYLVSLVIFCFVQYFSLSYFKNEQRYSFNDRIGEKIGIPPLPVIAHMPVVNNYKEEMSKITEEIRKNSENREVVIGFFYGDDEKLRTSLFDLCAYLLKSNLPNAVVVTGNAFGRRANYMDFVILYNNLLHSPLFNEGNITLALVKSLCERKIYQGKLMPDGIGLILYKSNQIQDVALDNAKNNFLGKDKDLGLIYY